jgi:peptide chain release factor 1
LICGPRVTELFADEPGGHRFQRVPPTEKRGRVHSSTITVAILPEVRAAAVTLDPRDLVWTTCLAGGAGGQHVQKTQSAVQLTHRPTGLRVRCESERSQHANRATALAILHARIAEDARRRAAADRDRARRAQTGSGERGDKRRTVRYQDGLVHDHVTGRTWRLRDYLRGAW